MSPAALSLAALIIVIAVSLTSRLNVGILAIALAWPIAVFSAGWKIDALMDVFPSGLFLTLVGVTLLFGVAHQNGTLAVIARRTVRRQSHSHVRCLTVRDIARHRQDAAVDEFHQRSACVAGRLPRNLNREQVRRQQRIRLLAVREDEAIRRP